jgi:membrane-bound lytic murein transglycosylase F
LIRALAALIVLAAAALPAAAQHGPFGETDDEYDELFRKYSKRYFGVAFDWRLFKAQAMAESNLVADAKSHVGARGVMQLMPSTFQEIQTRNPELESIDHPEWNIAAGICYDRTLWKLWNDHPTDGDRVNFMLGSYNAGRRTLLRAQETARQQSLDDRCWSNIREIAPSVSGWRYRETLGYVTKIEANLSGLKDGDGSAKIEPPQGHSANSRR